MLLMPFRQNPAEPINEFISTLPTLPYWLSCVFFKYFQRLIPTNIKNCFMNHHIIKRLNLEGTALLM